MIDLQLQIVTLIGIGAYLYNKDYLDDHTKQKLTDLLINIIIPCSILGSFQIDFELELLLNLIVILIGSLGVQILCYLINKSTYASMDEKRKQCCKYATMVSNASFVGLPIVASVYGNLGVLYASVFCLPQRITMWTYGLGLFINKKESGLFRKVIFHPCVSSIFIGLGIMIARGYGFHLPPFLVSTIESLGKCTTPLCMMIIGCSFSKTKLKDLIGKEVLGYSFMRLIVIPCIAIMLLYPISIDTLIKQVIIIMCAMPAAATTVVLAEKYNGDSIFASKILVASTLLSSITIPLILYVSSLI